jgi:glycosyltransferase involved in cell wall biosynthesis
MYLVYAPNVRAGGGLVLLQGLLAAWTGSPCFRAVFDRRAREVLFVPAGVSVDWTAPGAFSRVFAEWRLRAAVRDGAQILCFHGIPPIFLGRNARANITVFLQNRLVVERGSLRAYPLKTQMRVGLERWFFRRKIHSVGKIIVQSLSMRRAVGGALAGDTSEGPKIYIRPFVPHDLEPGPVAETHTFDFIYPANGEAHKNHSLLIEAWEILKADGYSLSLALTLGPQDEELWSQVKARVDSANLAVTNLGLVPRELMGKLYSSAGALILPSTTESFCLPLVEAARFDLPILAGELDYVRDVCEPVQTFDPNSAISIARAVKRYLRKAETQVPLEGPESFWNALAADSSTP